MTNTFSELESCDLKGKVMLIRLGVNVPVSEGRVSNDFRLRMSLPTLTALSHKGARLVAIGHREPAPEASLEPIAEYYNTHLPTTFTSSCSPEEVRARVEDLNEGEMLMLENLRVVDNEKDNDQEFASALASLADVYVNEAFSVAHREHASVVGVPRYVSSVAGKRFEREVHEVSYAFDPEHPFLFMLGGAKFETKLPLIQKFVESADTVFVGGALANTFFKAQGYEIGRSLVTEVTPYVEELLKKENILLPQDLTIETADGERRIVTPDEVSENDTIYDSGPRTVEGLSEKASAAKLVVWNGPLGNYEKGYYEQTQRLAESVSRAQGYSIIGGGDTVASIAELGLEDEFSFISTGGGAMLDLLVHETLPGIEALRDTPRLSL